jgi:hypothetical protein
MDNVLQKTKLNTLEDTTAESVTPRFREDETEASICVPKMFKSHV